MRVGIFTSLLPINSATFCVSLASLFPTHSPPLMHSTSSTAAGIQSNHTSQKYTSSSEHGALSGNNAGQVVSHHRVDHGVAVSSTGGTGTSTVSLLGPEPNGLVGLPQPVVVADARPMLNPNAQEFRPGGTDSAVGPSIRAQKGLLAMPNGENRGPVSSGASWHPAMRPHHGAPGVAGSGRQDIRPGGFSKHGGRGGHPQVRRGPPRVTGWEVPTPRPAQATATPPMTVSAGPSEGGLSSALQGRSSPTAAAGDSKLPAQGVELPALGAGPNRRNQSMNANFLLNFKYEEHKRQPPARQQPPRRREKLKPYNKELFLQANFRFLVSDLSDYSAALRDPDRMLDWEDVAAVEVLAPAALHCPICLEQPPCCPQITLCGHIFCFPCLLRYLTQGEGLAVDYKGDGPWKKCPLCFTLISVRDLRTASIRAVPQYKSGDTLCFTLLARAKGSIIPFERLETGGLINPSPTALCVSEDGQCGRFAKFTLTSSIEGVTRTATQALTALADRTSEGLLEDPDALPFIYGAMDHLHARAQAWTDHRSTAFLASSPPVRQRILAQAPAGQPKTPGKNPGDGGKALSGQPMKAGAGGSERAADMPTGWEGSDVAGLELKQRANWVYEDAFSDAGSEESGEARSVDARKESALKTIEEGLAAQRGAASEEDDPSATESGSDQEGPLSGFALAEGQQQRKMKQKKRLAQVAEDSGRGEGSGGTKTGVEGDEERAWYCFYQSSDGQPVFLHPLSMKCLLAHYGSYEALPPSMETALVEAENGTMASEGTRKKYRYLSHLSLTASFTLCEVDLRPLLPPAAFLPFLDEITARERRRTRVEKQEREQAARQARQAAQAAAANNDNRIRPPAPEDFAALLTAMEEADLEQALTASGGNATQGGSPPAAAPSPSVPIAFSAVTKMGYASAYDAPALGPAASSSQLPPSASPPPRWSPAASPTAGPVSFAAKLQAEKIQQAAQEPDATSSKKGKKGAKMLLSTGSARKY